MPCRCSTSIAPSRIRLSSASSCSSSSSGLGAWSANEQSTDNGRGTLMAAYLTSLSSLLAVSILAAAGLNITLGYGGVFSGGHAVFYGMGAYTVIYMAGSLHGQVLLVVPLALAVGILSGGVL